MEPGGVGKPPAGACVRACVRAPRWERPHPAAQTLRCWEGFPLQSIRCAVPWFCTEVLGLEGIANGQAPLYLATVIAPYYTQSIAAR